MKITLHVVGRMKAGPERELAERYLSLFSKAGPSLGLDFTGVSEQVESRARTAPERKKEEAKKLEAALADGALLILLDETGKSIGSIEFAEQLGKWRDAGENHLVLAIGGPDGHDRALKDAARLALSFGAMTWPHQLVRVMAAEQLYRAATILSGHPYHRA
ncbi:23S rRNA (pseudouridine(1915)-N(3))-methyltransferase RlmH [Limoniibacter endophyticus]|uniref:Ribosomal RNA large subunit methyltransferase H n=1 Tax=Limoniibacter endophyticus TaxID=1565040 RepID=A0A8J3DND9_9HYPH|nr:23S rRNA (pseudouridine(1915)-N(3))-methyltransferase RlmH [Limoniibacter endophyticus]GHC73782.1 ribosomal RNA large subunit methyltransferase H [Limoniibacter endophyticus]